MNKTAIGIVFIVILTIIVLSYFLLSKCPDGKERKGFKCVDKVSSTTSRSGLVGVSTGCTAALPFRYGSTCVASCPVGTLPDLSENCIRVATGCSAAAPFRNTLNNQCVASCPVERIADSEEKCVIPRQIIPMAGKTAACPSTHKYKEYGTCVNACAPGLFIDNTANQCVQVCPSARPVLRNGECFASCPIGTFRDLSNGVTPICVSTCPTSRPFNAITSSCQSCTTRTPSSLVNNNGACLVSCPAGTYRNDISMCVPINPLSTVLRSQISDGVLTKPASNMIDGNWSSLYESTSTSNTWVYFQNISKPGQMLYGFTIKFGSVSGTNNINLKMYNNNTTLTDVNKIFDETISNVGTDITIRRNLSTPRSVTNIYLLFDRKVLIHEFEVTVR
jgi:hypothetical protein